MFCQAPCVASFVYEMCFVNKVWVIEKQHKNECAKVHSLNLQVASPAIQIQMQVLNFSKFRELVVDVFLCGFFMYTRHKQDPAFNSYNQENTQSKIMKIV